jgi:hypothetical protein
MLRKTAWAFAVLFVAAGTLAAAESDYGLKKGTPDLKSAGPLAFGPDGILFIGDPAGAAIFAIDTGDRPDRPATGELKANKVDENIAGLLGTSPKLIRINHLAVNPASGAAFLSVARGQGPHGTPVIVRVDREGKFTLLPLEDVKFAKTALPNASEKQRQEAITHLAYVKGHVYVAGLSNEEFSSTFRSIPFPFRDADAGTSVEIYHGSHGRFETNSPVRTFVPYVVGGKPHLLAAYTCTPLVKIPISDLQPGKHVKGTTVAELGNRNRPLDMIVYQKDGKDYLLMANSSRGLMKIRTDGLDSIDAITARVRDKAGLTYDTITNMKGVVHLDKLDKDNALVLVRAEDGTLNLDTVALP